MHVWTSRWRHLQNFVVLAESWTAGTSEDEVPTVHAPPPPPPAKPPPSSTGAGPRTTTETLTLLRGVLALMHEVSRQMQSGSAVLGGGEDGGGGGGGEGGRGSALGSAPFPPLKLKQRTEGPDIIWTNRPRLPPSCLPPNFWGCNLGVELGRYEYAAGVLTRYALPPRAHLSVEITVNP